MKDNKKLKIYISILITIIIIAGVSYAYFFLRKEQTNENIIGTRTCLNSSLTEQNTEISLTDAFPISDEDGLKQTPFTFSVTNNCDTYVKLTITLENENRESTSTEFLKDNLIKVNLSPKGETTSSNLLLGSQTLVDIESSRKGYKLTTTGLKGNETKEFDLRTWMDSNTTLDEGLGKSWEGKIVIIVDAEEEPITWENPGTDTLLAAIKNKNTVTVPTTTPGAEISSSTEALLASTADDYGTSYYFRGAVTNNFVEYANMCWRIVRVTGNGAIKLVLYNYNGLTSTNNTPASSTPCNVTGNNFAFARYEGDTYKSAFNSSHNDNAYVGLMYGTASASSYAEAHANTNASTILTNLNKWYTNVLSKQANFKDSQLADTVWCNDKSVVTDATFNPEKYTLGTNYGYGANINYYSASKRLLQASSWSAGGTGPSLICPNDNNGGKLSKFTVSDTTYGNGALSGYVKVGLLTADEIAFAGGAAATVNSTYYIKGNTNSSMWWALSPFDFDGDGAYVWGVSGSLGYLVAGSVDNHYGVRPSLSLQSGVKISSGGVGSATSPYKIVA
ncbi:MAG: hypothetical protein MST00_01070 [Tenericutes bacterium]|nr:hypothetical protein [Mycoplasmatota bacterium]